MKRFKAGPVEFRSLAAPRYYIRMWRLILMYWPKERLSKRLEIIWRR